MSQDTIRKRLPIIAAVILLLAMIISIWALRPRCRTISGYCPLPGDTAHWPPDECWRSDTPRPDARCALHFFWRACDLSTANGGTEGCADAQRLREQGVQP